MYSLFLNILLNYSGSHCPIAVSIRPCDSMILFVVPIITIRAMSLNSSIAVYGTEGRFQPWATMCSIPAQLPWVIMGGHEV